MESAFIAEELSVGSIIFDEVKIREAQVGTVEYDRLKYSIQLEGVKLPILVRPKKDEKGNAIPGEYIGIDGCQRWSISKELNLDTIPARIVDASEDDCMRLQMILNRSRVKQTKLEEMNHVKTYMMHNPTMTQGEVALAFNMHQAELSNLLGLERLTKEATALVESGEINPTKAIALSRIPEDYQNKYLDDAKKMPTNEFLAHAKTEVKKIRAERRGESSKDILNLVLRKKKWFEDRLEELNHELETTDEDHEDYLFIAGKLEFCKESLQIDEATLKAKEAEKEAEKEKKKAEKEQKIPKEVADHIADLEARLAQLTAG